jgi:eukaryotic-like serine/threonine-protein kinase
MDAERWKRIEALFEAALKRPPEERAAFMHRSCGGDEELKREVRSLAAGRDAAGFLENPALEETALDQTQTAWIGQRVAQYQILERLGAGGMGVVYKAHDTRLDRLAALKFLPPHLRTHKDLKQRLAEEARAASTLDHPNIVVIYDIGETAAGDLFIAMAYHEGATVRQRIDEAKGKGLPVAEALDIARQIASGLAKAHDRGVFHRDIKPGNIIAAKDGVARIIDFGLAKSSDATATQDGSTKGTPQYMSPEQTTGKPLDCRTDLWSLGAVLYEMLAGTPPFAGESHLSIMRAIVHDTPRKLSELRPEVPAEVESIVSRSMEKNLAMRYQSAAEMARDLSAALGALEAPAKPAGLRVTYAIAALAMVLLLAGLSLWFYRRSENRHWAREQGIPEIARLTRENKPVVAYLLMRKVAQYLPGDPQVAQIADGLTHVVSVRSSPPGALVEIKDYLSPGDRWFALGTTPLENVKLPTGYLRWRVSRPGMEEYTGAPLTDLLQPVREFHFELEAAGTTPKGMAPVPAVKDEFILVWSIGGIGPFNLPKFYIDRFEVTNRQYQEFVDQGGYRKRDYWKEKFLRDGKELSWEQAMNLFRDTTGRPGPSTWAAGHYPAGEADYPVGGVSWYEAAAYAEFAGKSLPALEQWYLAAPSSVAKSVVQLSNFSLSGPAPAGKYQGLGPYGTYDMGGNMSEWCLNEAGKGYRFNLGGAWNTASSDYWEPDALPPFDRLANDGFRCVRNTAALPPAATAEMPPAVRDFSKAKPVSDEVFRIYKGMYAYDRTPLNVRSEPVAQDSADWRKEKITIDAAYGNERMALYLFLPAKVRPPYQTVVFFPSARVKGIPDSKTLGDTQFIDYVIQSGRAVLYPVFKGTYERPSPDNTPSTAAGREILIQESKDLGRSIDYLETRADIDRERMVYMGVSMGAALGVIFTAVEERLKGAIFLDGGFFVEKMLPGADQADFVPRIKVPVLLISGKYDWIFLGKDALIRLLGTPAANKKAVLFDTAHNASEQRTDMIREVLGWLDRYLGKVN